MKKALKQLFCLFLVFASVIFVASCTVTPNTPEEPGDNLSLGDKHNALTVKGAVDMADSAGSTPASIKVYGTVTEVVDYKTGQMYITDGKYTICVASVEGYKTLENRPTPYDEVVFIGEISTVNGDVYFVATEVVEVINIKGDDEVEYVDPTEEVLTIEQAIALALEVGEAGTTEKYKVTGTVKTVSNSLYGEMYITDGTNDLYIYGIEGYSTMENKPVKGYEVVVSGIIKMYKGTAEMGRSDLISFVEKEPVINLDDYTSMTIAEVRNVEAETLVKITGVVAQITYATGMVPNGVFVVDGTNSIYVYGRDVAGQVSVGNKITVAGSKAYYVLDTEISYAEKWNYKGCNQLESAILLENDKQTNEIDLTWVEETTVKEIMNTPWSSDITTSIYKVTALIKKAEGNGFTNYYIDDLDGFTGSYSYSQASGNDFAWLDQYDGKICTVYMSVINAKSTQSGCVWRFVPIKVIDEGFTFDMKDAPEYAIEYGVIDLFLNEYTTDPQKELPTEVSNEVLGFEGVEIFYTTSNIEIFDFVYDTPGTCVFHVIGQGTGTITITATYGEYVAERTITIDSVLPATYEYNNVKFAMDAADDEVVTIKGIVAGGIANKEGFYLVDETGVITVTTAKANLSDISVGNEVIIRGVKGHNKDAAKTHAGQANIYDAEILVNNYGKHDYSTATFIEGKTFDDIKALNVNDDIASQVYILRGTITIIETEFFSSIQFKDANGTSLTLYCSGANQYSWAKDYSGQEVTVEFAICNWNNKTFWAGCLLSLTTDDGVKVNNTYNLAG